MDENTKAWIVAVGMNTAEVITSHHIAVAVGYSSVSVVFLRESAYGRYWCICNLD